MALHFDFSKVENHQEVTTDPQDNTKWHPVADALVWLSMICGYNEITEKNFEKVAARILAYQKASQPMLCGPKGMKVLITERDVARYIGMTTNASTMTDAQWERKLGKIAMENGRWLDRVDNILLTPTALSIFGLYKPA